MDGTPGAPAPRPAGEVAYEGVMEMILSGRLTPEVPVAERRLATALGVSRTPLREALRRLEGEGMLGRRPDGTLAVRRLDVEEVLEILKVRRLLEAEAAAAAAGAVPAATLDAIRARIRALLASGDPMSPDRLAVDQGLHGAVGEACGNRTLAALIADLRRRTTLFATRWMPERMEPVCEEHLAILDALAAGDGAAARDAMAAHIESTRDGIRRRLLAM